MHNGPTDYGNHNQWVLDIGRLKEQRSSSSGTPPPVNEKEINGIAAETVYYYTTDGSWIVYNSDQYKYWRNTMHANVDELGK